MTDIPPFDSLSDDELRRLTPDEMTIAIAQTQAPVYITPRGELPEIEAFLEAGKPLGDPSVDIDAYRRRYPTGWRRLIPRRWR